jgi:hypothetical protein
MKNFYERINEQMKINDIKDNSGLMEINYVKGIYFEWVEDVFAIIDNLKDCDKDTIKRIKLVINAPASTNPIEKNI